VPAANLPNIVVHEEPAGSWHIVLPARPADAGDLSDADLEKVAGGTTPVSVAVSIVVTTMTIGIGNETVKQHGW
jgi:hypothetical protein